jgi:LmbE family N-acetylglucosaminyl deacetylase
VVVATLFTNGQAAGESEDVLEARRREDIAALTALGVGDPMHLGFLDAPFRNSLYSDGAAIVTGEHPDDRMFFAKLSSKVASLYTELTPQTVFLPLAVGTHIDHRLTHQVWQALPPTANVVFYEDRPYSLLPCNLQLRLKQIRAAAIQPGVGEALVPNPIQAMVSFHDGLKRVSFYKNMMLTPKDRLLYLLYVTPGLLLAGKNDGLRVQSEVIDTTDPDEINQIKTAVSAYESQLPILYTDIDTFAQESAAYATTSLHAQSQYAERYWALLR